MRYISLILSGEIIGYEYIRKEESSAHLVVNFPQEEDSVIVRFHLKKFDEI